MKDIIKEDLNIAKLPIFQTVKKKGKSLKIIRKKDNEKQMVLVGIVNDIEVGTFTTLDYKVFMFLIKKYLDLEDKNDLIKLNLKEILEEINFKNIGGSAYKMIKKSLKRLATIPIFFTNFVKKQNGQLIQTEEMMYLIKSNVKFTNSRIDGKTDNKITLQLSKLITNNLDEHYTKPLIFSEIKKLKNEISVILYRYLDIILANSDYVKKDWMQLSKELCFSYKFISEVKRAVLPALEELKGKYITTGLLSDFKKTRTGFIYYKENKKMLDIKQNFIQKENIPKKTKAYQQQVNSQNKEEEEKNKLLIEFELLKEEEKNKFKTMADDRAKEKFKKYWDKPTSQEIALLEILRENL
jgi:hypothetical protein